MGSMINCKFQLRWKLSSPGSRACFNGDKFSFSWSQHTCYTLETWFLRENCWWNTGNWISLIWSSVANSEGLRVFWNQMLHGKYISAHKSKFACGKDQGTDKTKCCKTHITIVLQLKIWIEKIQHIALWIWNLDDKHLILICGGSYPQKVCLIIESMVKKYGCP